MNEQKFSVGYARVDITPEQYGPMGGHGRGPSGRIRGPRPQGKPKNSGATIRRLMGYIAAYRFRLVVVLCLMLINTVTAVAGGYLLRDVINAVDTSVEPGKSLLLRLLMPDAVASGVLTKTQRVECLGIILGVLAGIYFVGIVTSYLQGRLMLTVSQSAVEKIRNDLFVRLQRLPVRYFDAHPTGELMSRFSNDVDAIDMMINSTVTSLISGTISLVGTVFMMFYTSWFLALITLLFVPLYLFGGGLIGKKSAKYHVAQQTALGAVNGYIEETVTGSKVVKVFNHEEVSKQEFDKLNNTLCENAFSAVRSGLTVAPPGRSPETSATFII